MHGEGYPERYRSGFIRMLKYLGGNALDKALTTPFKVWDVWQGHRNAQRAREAVWRYRTSEPEGELYPPNSAVEATGADEVELTAEETQLATADE